MYKWNGRVAIVTGASTAIGQSICRALVENGLTVCAIAKKTGCTKLDVSHLNVRKFSKCQNSGGLKMLGKFEMFVIKSEFNLKL